MRATLAWSAAAERREEGRGTAAWWAWHQEEVDRVVELCYSMSSIADTHSTMIGTWLGQAYVALLSVASDPSLEVYYN